MKTLKLNENQIKIFQENRRINWYNQYRFDVESGDMKRVKSSLLAGAMLGYVSVSETIPACEVVQ